MQFSIISIFLAVAASAVAAPVALKPRLPAGLTSCLGSLSLLGISCGSSIVQLDLDPVTDFGCIASAIADIVKPPAACTALLR